MKNKLNLDEKQPKSQNNNIKQQKTRIKMSYYLYLVRRGTSFTKSIYNKPNFVYFLIIANLFILTIMATFSIGLVSLREIMGTTSDFAISAPSPEKFSNFKTFFDIFFNNIEKAYMAMFAGVLFGIFPVYFIYTNSVIIGIVSAFVYLGSGSAVVFAGLVPHGITECTAIIMSSGYGLWLGIKFIKMIIYKQRDEFKDAFFLSLNKYVKVIVPLLLFSAIIETWVTPHVIVYFSK